MVSGGDGRPKRWYLCPSMVKKFKCDSTAKGRQPDGCACVSATVQANTTKHCLFGDGACHVVLVLSERTRVLCGERGAMVSSSRYADIFSLNRTWESILQGRARIVWIPTFERLKIIFFQSKFGKMLFRVSSKNVRWRLILAHLEKKLIFLTSDFSGY